MFFSAHEIDEEALSLFDEESLEILIPQIGFCKIRKFWLSPGMPKRRTQNRRQYVNDIKNVFEVILVDHAVIQPAETKFDVTAFSIDQWQEIGETLKFIIKIYMYF